VIADRLSERVLEPEVMDDPGLDERRHFDALRGLARLNRVSSGAGHLWQPIRSLARQLGTKRLRLLDIASGGGDIPISLWRRAQRSGLELEILGVDVSPRAVEFARHQAEQARAGVQFAVCDAMDGQLPTGYDAIVCSLFLHHLHDDQARRLLQTMASAAGHAVVVSDLIRSRLNLALVRIGAALVTRSDVVHSDGAQSVRAAFSLPEARQLARDAGLDGAQLKRCFPCRFVLTWRRQR
jgi:2-polyprenyl-3-methyl-5-hydroxy-6-metoxy-1,4-benzoquinol methylase